MNQFTSKFWPGLASYKETDQEIFFGRNKECGMLVDAINSSLLSTVYGPSGAGKTSLLRAGVFPRLRKEGYLPVYVRLNHAENASAYRHQVQDAVLEAAKGERFQNVDSQTYNVRRTDETLWEWLHRLNLRDEYFNPIIPVILFDQFEEIFTLADSERSTEWIAELNDVCMNLVPSAVALSQPVLGEEWNFSPEDACWRIVLSLREDFLSKLEEITSRYPVFQRNRIAVTLFTFEQALDAVVKPGKDIVSRPVAEKIVQSLLGESSKRKFSDRVDPAWLSLLCRQLDIRRQEKHASKISEELLDVHRENIIVDTYAEAIERVPRNEVDLIEKNLVTASGARNLWEENEALGSGVRKDTINHLVEARILHRVDISGAQRIELRHDRLLDAVKVTQERRQKEAEKLRKDIERQRQESEKQRFSTQLLEQRKKYWKLGGLGTLAVVMALVFAYFATFRWIAIALLGLPFAVGGLMWYFFFREYVSYYRQFTTVWGAPRGLGPRLSVKDVRHRLCSFKLYCHGRFSFDPHGRSGSFLGISASRVYRVDAVDSHMRLTTEHEVEHPFHTNEVAGSAHDVASQGNDNPIDESTRSIDSAENIIGKDIQDEEDAFHQKLMMSKLSESHQSGNTRKKKETEPKERKLENSSLSSICSWEYKYDRDGRPLLVIERNDKGVIVCCRSYVFDQVIKDWRKQVKWHLIDKNGYPFRMQEHKAQYAVVSYNDLGYELRVEYQTRSGTRTYGANKVQSELSEYDIDGYPTKVWGQNWNESTFCNAIDFEGKCGVFYQRSSDEREVFVRCFGVEEEPTATTCGIATVHKEFDEWGNEIKVSFGDLAGGRAADNNGVSRYERNLQFESGEISGCTLRWYALDASRGMLNTPGWHQHEIFMNAFGQVTRVRYLGLDGNLVPSVEGVTHTETTYREDGVTMMKFDAYAGVGAGITGVPGYYHLERMFNDKGQEVLERHLDGDGNLVPEANGVTHDETTYRADGTTKLRYDAYAEVGVGLNGVPGYYHLERLFNDKGQEISERHLDRDGKLVTDAIGVTHDETAYREDGTTKLRYDAYAEVGAGINGVSGYYHLERTFNDKGQEISERHLDRDGNLVPDAIGVTHDETAYREDGTTKLRYDAYAEAGAGLNGVSGYYHLERTFNDKGQEISEQHLDRDGNLVPDANGMTHDETTYREDGITKLRRDAYAEAGDGLFGAPDYHHLEQSFNDKGQVALVRHLDWADNLVPSAEGVTHAETTYREDGVTVLRIDAYAEVGAGINGVSGYYHLERTFNDKGQEISERHLDRDGNLVPDADGVTSGETTYREDGITKLRHDRYEEVVDAASGALSHRHMQMMFNEKEQVIMIKQMDHDGMPVPMPEMESMTRGEMSYYSDGVTIARVDSYAEAGVGLGGVPGYYHCQTVNNEKGQDVSNHHYDRDGKLIPNAKGITHDETKYREDGVTKCQYDAYAEVGDGISGVPGYYHLQRSFNEKGHEILEQHLDREGNPVPDENGVASIKTDYYDNEETRKLVEKMFGRDGSKDRADAVNEITEFDCDGEEVRRYLRLKNGTVEMQDSVSQRGADTSGVDVD